MLSLPSPGTAPTDAALKSCDAFGANADRSAAPPRRTFTAPDVAASTTPSLSFGKRCEWWRQQSMASSKLPTMANDRAVMRAGSQSTTAQALIDASCSDSLTGCACVRLRCRQ